MLESLLIGAFNFVLIFLILSLIINFWLNDVRLPNLNIKNKKNILVIYPHPDDEVWMSGGLMFKLAKQKDVNIFAVSITHGEHGDEILKLPPEELAKVRAEEYKKVMAILGVKNFELWDFVDGESQADEARLQSKIAEFVKQNNIDLVITYEKLGLYGHPDHIVLAKVVNAVSKEQNVDALFSTLPDKILKRIDLPKTLTYKDRVVNLTLDKIATPEYKLNVIESTFVRYKAVKQYKSQKTGGGKPLWLVVAFSNYEYYTTKFDGDLE